MHGINLNMFINEDYIFILRNNSLLKYTQDYTLVDSKYCQYNLIKEYDNIFYLYDGKDIYKSTDLDLINISKYKEVGNIKDFHIYESDIYFIKDNQLFYPDGDNLENIIEDIYFWDTSYLYYNFNNYIYKIDLIHKQLFMHSTIKNVSCIYAHKNILIYGTTQGKIHIQGEEERTLHKHDNSIQKIYLNKNILYILTKDNKFSILDMYRDTIRYIIGFCSTTNKIERYKDEIMILNEFEFIRYDIKSGTQIIKYNIPNIDKVYIPDDSIGEGEVSIDPLYHDNDECDLIIKYGNNLILTKDLVITSVYNINNINIFYTSGYICVQLKNRIEIYKRGINKLYFVRTLKNIDNISDIKEENGVFYYVVGDDLIKSSIINLKVGKLKKNKDSDIPDGYNYKKILGDSIYLIRKNVLDIYDKNMELVRNLEFRRCIKEIVREGLIIDERGELINY